MQWRHYTTCLWPGLAELWWRGRLTALSLAIPFAVAINLFLVTRYIYPDWISPALVAIGFWTGLVVWLFYVIHSIRELPELLAPRRVSNVPDVFPEAQAAYLSGNWSAAEKLLNQVLSVEPRDPPALLLLTGTYRHTDRLESAEILLEQIARLEVSEGWLLEIQTEEKRLQRALKSTNRGSLRESASEEHDRQEAAELTAIHRPEGRSAA